MAVNKTVNKRTNSHGAMRNCIEYVLRQDKTSEQLADAVTKGQHEYVLTTHIDKGHVHNVRPDRAMRKAV